MDRIEFINQIVYGYIKSDLIKMRDTIRPDQVGNGNINFPLALCTLAYLEYLGGFILGTNINFYQNVDAYISNCFTNKTEYPVEILKDLFRNGLAHEYFPRGGVSRNGKHPTIYKGNNFDIVLDAETLTTDFLNSLAKFVSQLTDEKYNNRMKQAMISIENWKENKKDLISNLPIQPNDDDTATPSFGLNEPFVDKNKSSGASGLSRAT